MDPPNSLLVCLQLERRDCVASVNTVLVWMPIASPQAGRYLLRRLAFHVLLPHHDGRGCVNQVSCAARTWSKRST